MDELTDSDRLDWLEDVNTLHQSVEILYVVDGYEITICDDRNGDVVVHGETIRDAIDAAMVLRPTRKNA